MHKNWSNVLEAGNIEAIHVDSCQEVSEKEDQSKSMNLLIRRSYL